MSAKTRCKIEYWPLDRIKPYPKNAKRHKIHWIAKSIEEFDFDQPIVVDSQGVIIKGHGRFEAAKKLELKEVPIIIRNDLTAQQIKLSRLADNRSNQGAGFDEDLLAMELEDLKIDFDMNQLSGFGFNEAFLRKIAVDEISSFFYEEEDDITEEKEYIQSNKKYALSIVIDEELNNLWENYKKDNKCKTDNAGFKAMLKEVIS